MSKYPAPRGRVRCRRRLEQSLAPGFFRALSDPSRLSLLVQLAGCGRPCTVSEMAACCPVDVSVVSRHLAFLRDAGLLESEKRGKAVYYAVRYAQVAESLRAIADAIDGCCPADCRVSAVCVQAQRPIESADQTRRMNPAGRTRASVGPEGRTERSN